MNEADGHMLSALSDIFLNTYTPQIIISNYYYQKMTSMTDNNQLTQTHILLLFVSW